MTKFLNATEYLFGKHGYEGTTIRAIAAKAHVNLGTLKHYWGSKRELFRALFERRFRPMQEEHMRRLRELEHKVSDGSRPEVLQVLRTLIEPTFFVGETRHAASRDDMQSAQTRKRFHMLLGRALMDPSPAVIAEMTRLGDEPMRLFLSLMQRACPELTLAELDWRVNCVLGAQVFSQLYTKRVGRFYGGEADVDDALACDWTLHCLMNGFNARPSAIQ